MSRTDRQMLHDAMRLLGEGVKPDEVRRQIDAHVRQGSIFSSIPDPPVVQPTIPQNPNRENLRDAAEAWIAANGEVYQEFVRQALEFARAGRPRFGIGLLAERIRWSRQQTNPGEVFKINNNYRAYIARKIVAEHPELEGKLVFRETRY